MLDYISFLSIPLIAFSSVPQIIMMRKTKNSNGISLNMFFATFMAVFLLFIEAYKIKNIIIMTADVLSMTAILINIFLIIKYRK